MISSQVAGCHAAVGVLSIILATAGVMMRTPQPPMLCSSTSTCDASAHRRLTPATVYTSRASLVRAAMTVLGALASTGGCESVQSASSGSEDLAQPTTWPRG